MSRHSQENDLEKARFRGEKNGLSFFVERKQKELPTLSFGELRRFWEEDERSLREQIRKSMGQKTLHEVRRSLRRRIRMGFLVGLAGRLATGSRKNLDILSKAYRSLGPCREQDVFDREWRRLCRNLQDIAECSLVSRMEKTGKRKTCRRRKRLLERALRKTDGCFFPVLRKEDRTEVVSDSSVFTMRLRKFLSDREAKLEHLASRWGKLGPGGRHQLRKVVRVLHESWVLLRKISPALPDGEAGKILAKLDQSLGRLHDRDLSFEKLCRMRGYSGKKGWRRALISGWYAGISGRRSRKIGRLLERYRKIPCPWVTLEKGSFIPSDGSSPPG